MTIDKNGDGYLSLEEIQSAVDKVDLKVDCIELLKQCDTDENGYVNYSEFLAATVNRTEAYTKENLKNTFRRFDKNNDGVISLEELRAAIGVNSNQDSVFMNMIEEADTNKDGFIDLDEFVAHMTASYQTRI